MERGRVLLSSATISAACARVRGYGQRDGAAEGKPCLEGRRRTRTKPEQCYPDNTGFLKGPLDLSAAPVTYDIPFYIHYAEQNSTSSPLARGAIFESVKADQRSRLLF